MNTATPYRVAGGVLVLRSLKRVTPALLDEEEKYVRGAAAERVKEFAGGRAAARQALEVLGLPPATILTGRGGQPLWPANVCGSISHTSTHVVALVAHRKVCDAVGVDINDERPLGCRAARDVTWNREVALLQTLDVCPSLEAARNLAFSAKEAIYKCQYATLLKQFRTAKEEGDFRGRALEINFADCFVQQGIVLDQAVKQGTKGDIDFCWKLGEHALYLEMKLLGQDREMRDRINAQLEEKSTFGVMLKCDTKDIARLQTDLIYKSSTRKFNPTPDAKAVNLVCVDVSELQLGMADPCDCFLAAGGNTVAARHCDPVCLRESVVGLFETIPNDKLNSSQKEWLTRVDKLLDGAPHPRTYIHGALFLFRRPKERAALSYDLQAVIVWNPALVDHATAKALGPQLHKVIPPYKARRDA